MMNAITGYVDARRFIGDVLIVMSAVLLLVVLVTDSLGAEGVPLRTLRGENYDAARDARDQADLMRADMEGRLSGPPAERPQISQEEIEAETAKIEQAYQEVIDRYPHTEIAAYCALRLSGFYVFQGNVDKAVELVEQTAKEFSGTSVGNRAIFSAGMMHLQARHDPAEAIKWLSRVPKPEKHEGTPYGEDDKLYLSAQESLAKCELLLQQDGKAQDRITKLKNAYPQYAQELDRSYQFEVNSRNRSGDASLLPSNQKSGQSNIYRLIAMVSSTAILLAMFIFRYMRKRKV